MVILMDNKVSIIIPTYNRKKLLKNAIQSVLKQTYKNLEIVIVDDGSSDGTQNLIDNINNNKIKYIRNEKSVGGSQARNIGINNSTGKYITFLDDDDEYLPEKIEKQVLKFNNNNIGLVYTGVILNYIDLNIKYKIIPDKKG